MDSRGGGLRLSDVLRGEFVLEGKEDRAVVD